MVKLPIQGQKETSVPIQQARCCVRSRGLCLSSLSSRVVNSTIWGLPSIAPLSSFPHWNPGDSPVEYSQWVMVQASKDRR